MAFDTKKWLVEELGFSEADATDLLPKFDGDRAAKVEKGYLRQSDYSKKMNDLQAEVKQQQTDLQAANERLNQEMAEWASLTAAEKEQATKQRGELEKAQQDVLRLQQVVTRVATEAGMDPQKVLEGAAVTVKKDEPVKAPEVDLSGVVKVDAFSRFADAMLTFPAELNAIAREHFDLTGQHLDTREIVKELKARAGTKGNQKSLEPRDIWEELHQIPDKRTEVEKKKFDEAMAAAEARGREAALSEASVPGQQPKGRSAPVFFHGGKERESVLERPQPGQGLQSAISALRSGKYRSGEKTA